MEKINYKIGKKLYICEEQIKGLGASTLHAQNKLSFFYKNNDTIK